MAEAPCCLGWMGQKVLLVPWEAVTLKACTAGWNQDAAGKRNDGSGSERIRRKHCWASEAALESDRKGLGSAPSPPIPPSNTSPSEPKLRSVSKANVGTFPFSVLGLLYIHPWVFLIQICKSQEQIFSPCGLEQALTKSIMQCVSLGNMCSMIATVMNEV